MHRSERNSTIIGLLSGGMIGLVGFCCYLLSFWLNARLSSGPVPLPGSGVIYALQNSWIFIIGGGLFGWAIRGGWAVLRQAILRWLLQRHHIFPRQTEAFLDDATSRILLRRVGGGYSFIHRLLMVYFADHDESTLMQGHRSACGLR